MIQRKNLGHQRGSPGVCATCYKQRWCSLWYQCHPGGTISGAVYLPDLVEELSEQHAKKAESGNTPPHHASFQSTGGVQDQSCGPLIP